MAIIYPGLEIGFALVIAIMALALASLYLCKQGIIKPKIRRIAALEALEEGVGRAAEMGRPVHFTTGRKSIMATGLGGFPAVMAGFAILLHLAELCVEREVPLIVSVGRADSYPLQYEIVSESYRAAGHPELFRPENIRFCSREQHAYSSAVLETLHEEHCATNVMVGGFGGEAALLAEGGFTAGCLQIGGNPRIVQIHYFVVICDYVLLGEEVFAAGASLRKRPEELGTLLGQDLTRYICLALLIIGGILSTAGINWLYEIL